ncbi:hypothetical protein CEXT_249701, partial [Caerostris extrusa]
EIRRFLQVREESFDRDADGVFADPSVLMLLTTGTLYGIVTITPWDWGKEQGTLLSQQLGRRSLHPPLFSLTQTLPVTREACDFPRLPLYFLFLCVTIFPPLLTSGNRFHFKSERSSLLALLRGEIRRFPSKFRIFDRDADESCRSLGANALNYRHFCMESRLSHPGDLGKRTRNSSAELFKVERKDVFSKVYCYS